MTDLHSSVILSAPLSVVTDISSIRDVLLLVKELGTKARLYEPSLAKAGPHLQRLGAENDKERLDARLRLVDPIVLASMIGSILLRPPTSCYVCVVNGTWL